MPCAAARSKKDTSSGTAAATGHWESWSLRVFLASVYGYAVDQWGAGRILGGGDKKVKFRDSGKIGQEPEVVGLTSFGTCWAKKRFLLGSQGLLRSRVNMYRTRVIICLHSPNTRTNKTAPSYSVHSQTQCIHNRTQRKAGVFLGCENAYCLWHTPNITQSWFPRHPRYYTPPHTP